MEIYLYHEPDVKVEINNYDTENPLLKPCPFCGATPNWHLIGNDHTPSRTIVIKCPQCGVEMKKSGRVLGVQPIASKIINTWNERKHNV